MGRDIDNKVEHDKAGNPAHLQSAIEEIRQAQVRQYRTCPESAPIQIPVPSVEQVAEKANKAWTDLGEPALKKLNDLREIQLPGSKSPWRDLDLSACSKAYETFPSLTAHNVSRSLIPALIGNELRHYKVGMDNLEDLSVDITGTIRDPSGVEKSGASVGPAQMQLANICRLAASAPQLNDFKHDPARAALDPAKAPYFVAAYLEEAIKNLERRGIEPTTDALAYMYNPDLRGQKNMEGEEFGPYIQASKIDSLLMAHHFAKLVEMDYPNLEILKISKHVKNVRETMRIVERSN